MKSDVILKIIASLLIPFLALSGFLVITSEYRIFGFFTLISATICLLSLYLLYCIKYGKIKIKELAFFRFLILGISGIFIGFLFYIMLKLINIF